MSAEGIARVFEFRISAHAWGEMARRGISQSDVASVLNAPDQAFWVRPPRALYQSVFVTGCPTRQFLLRVVVDLDRRPPVVVTAYRTSRVEKYWRSEQ